MQVLFVYALHTGAKQQRQGRGCGFFAVGIVDLCKALVCFVFEFQAGQGPAYGAVAQGAHRVRDACVHQRLGADDAARATGAVHHDASCCTRCQAARTQHQFRAGHADGARDAHGLVFVKTPGVQHHHVSVAVDQSLDLGGRHRRCLAFGFDQFAEGFAGHIDVAEQLTAGGGPAAQTILKNTYLRITHARQHLCRTQRQTLAVVQQHHRCVQARYAQAGIAFDAAIRKIDGKQRMALRVHVFFAHIDQSDFLFVQQRLTHILEGGDCISRRGCIRRVVRQLMEWSISR